MYFTIMHFIHFLGQYANNLLHTLIYSFPGAYLIHLHANNLLHTSFYSFPGAYLIQLYANHLLHTSVCTVFISRIEYQIERKAGEDDGCENANQIQDLASNMVQ